MEGLYGLVAGEESLRGGRGMVGSWNGVELGFERGLLDKVKDSQAYGGRCAYGSGIPGIGTPGTSLVIISRPRSTARSCSLFRH